MINNIKSFIWIILATLVIAGCQQEEFELSETPISEADATFSVTQSTQGPNYYTFKNESNGFIKSWDFGNGTSAKGNEVTGYFPFEGVYDITLTVFNAGGSTTSTQSLTIDATDPAICDVEVLQFLTGGCDAANGKTWVIAKDVKGHLGLGPAAGSVAEWYEAGPNEKDGGGMYDDEYTFILNQSVFDMETNGNIYLRGDQASKFPGAFDAGVGDLSAPYDSRVGSYSISSDEAGAQFINLSAGSFIGFYTGSNSYQIMSINENEMYIRQQDLGNPALAWYQRLIRKGFAPLSAGFTSAAEGLTVTFTNTSANADTYSWNFGDGSMSAEENPVHTYAAAGTYTVTLTTTSPGQEQVATAEVTVVDVPLAPKALPMTFEDGVIDFFGFGFGGAESQMSVIDNPDPSGINTSSKVAQLVKGAPEWSGIGVTLENPINFSNNPVITMKVWSPVTGIAKLKFEESANAASSTEVDANITVTNQWTELTFDFTGSTSDLYDNLILFMDFGVNNGGTFYFDDVQYQYRPKITLNDLTDGGSKTWTYKQDNSAWGVGPARGDVQWFNAGPADRPCIFNDTWTFNVNGMMEYDTNGDIFVEGYMGLAVGDGCQPDTSLDGTDAASWGSGSYSFALSQGSASDPAYLTLIGQGAFIGLQKAYNGGEYTAPPPSANANITYTIHSYDPVTEELGVSIDVGGGVFWSFILVPES